MRPQTEAFLEKARHLLENAGTMLRVGLNEDAGRTAYLAGYHAAQAFLFERTDKIFKTHRGVQGEFGRLTKDDPYFDFELRAFLGRTYDLKTIADYESGPDATLTGARRPKPSRRQGASSNISPACFDRVACRHVIGSSTSMIFKRDKAICLLCCATPNPGPFL